MKAVQLRIEGVYYSIQSVINTNCPYLCATRIRTKKITIDKCYKSGHAIYNMCLLKKYHYTMILKSIYYILLILVF